MFLVGVLFYLVFAWQLAWGQGEEALSDQVAFEREIDVNFLFNYYDQDGDHAAVTGGVGNEALRDLATKVHVVVPLDPVSSMAAMVGVNHYTSASTDRIDNNVSSASRADIRSQMELAYARADPARAYEYGFNFGGSLESDYISTWLGADWTWVWPDGNRRLSVGGQAYFDTWTLYLPVELRPFAHQQLQTDKRRSYSLALTYHQVLGRRLQSALSTELVYQSGLLSTPFHRVFFADRTLARIEKLPGRRFKVPLGLRLNYFFLDNLVLRLYYRFYADSFGIDANTFSVEAPLKIGHSLSVYPLYRYHNQSKARYFKAFGQHRAVAEYYTSDFDLSGFASHKVGFGLRYAPVFGLGRVPLLFGQGDALVKSLSLRLASYRRGDGLEAVVASIGLAFSLD